MTAPIQEPTTDRALQGFAYQRDQIFRRPPVVSAGIVKGLRLWTENMNKTFNGGGTDQNFDFDNISSYDATVFTPQISAGRYYAVYLLLAGWYSMFVDFVWTSAKPTTGSTALHFLFAGDSLSGASFQYANTGFLHVGPYPAASLTRYFPAEGDALPGSPEVWMGQNSGTNKVVDVAYWQLVYHGSGDF